MNDKIKEELKKILGEDAFSMGNMQVSERVQKLVWAVNYLVIQLNMVTNLVEEKDNLIVKSHIEDVIDSVGGILSK